MSESSINYDPYNFNNGVAPASGLFWTGGAWAWPTSGPQTRETMYAVVDSTDLPENIKKSIKDNIWLKCGKKNCPYIQGNGYKSLRDAINSGDRLRIRRIYQGFFAPFYGATLGTRNTAIQKEEAAQQQAAAAYQTGLRLVSDFYETLSLRLGDRENKIAKDLADASKSASVHGVDDAVKTFENFGRKFGTVFTDVDRQALSNALKSVNSAEIADKYVKYGKAFNTYGIYDDATGLYNEFIKSMDSNNWRPFFVKATQIAASRGASALTAWVYAFLATSVMTLPLYALLISVVGALVDTALIDKIYGLFNI